MTNLLQDTFGTRINQQDWHLLRGRAAEFLGEPLRRDVVPVGEATGVARDFYDWASAGAHGHLPPREEWVHEFASHNNTSGTLHIMNYLMVHGLPDAVSNRPRRQRRHS